MNIELTNKLFAAHPKLLGHLEQTSQGIEHADGWFDILDRLFFDIQDYINQQATHRSFCISYNHAVTQAIAGNEIELRTYYIHRHNAAMYENGESKEFLDEIKDMVVPGWLDSFIESDIKHARLINIPDAIEQVVVVQVKEKFGSLRVYYDGGDATVDRMIESAALMAETTCEVCGIDGVLQDVNGWQRVVCVNHQAAAE